MGSCNKRVLVRHSPARGQVYITTPQHQHLSTQKERQETLVLMFQGTPGTCSLGGSYRENMRMRNMRNKEERCFVISRNTTYTYITSCLMSFLKIRMTHKCICQLKFHSVSNKNLKKTKQTFSYNKILFIVILSSEQV